MDMPEVELKDVDIRLENQTLTVKGERKFENLQDSKAYHRIERSYGTFARTFTLPDTVDTEKVRADYKNGVLQHRAAEEGSREAPDHQSRNQQ